MFLSVFLQITPEKRGLSTFSQVIIRVKIV